MASVEKISLKELALQIIALLKGLKNPPYVNPINRVKCEVEALPTIATVTTVRNVESFGAEMVFKELYTRSALVKNYNRNIVS